MKEKTKKLFGNTIIFFIGSIGSKLIQFFLIPLYTYTLTTEQYGVTDYVFMAINFLMPFFSIQLSDSVLRFGLDKSKNQEDVINATFKLLMIGTIFSILLSPLLKFVGPLKDWIVFFVLIMNLRIYRDILAILLKVREQNKLFAVDSIVYTFVLCVSSILLLVVYPMQIKGYFLSYVIANLISILFICIASKMSFGWVRKPLDKELTKKIVIYSIPLIFNSIAFWVNAAFDRYMLEMLVGMASVGIYAIASKIPSIMTTFAGIFNQAWLISSINEFETEKDVSFYADIFKHYCSISYVMCALILFVIEPFMKFYVSHDYVIAWKYAMFLILAAVFSGICAFVNSILYAYKKNVSSTITTICGAGINVILNLVLIPRFEILGACIATVISWFVIMLLRFYFVKKIIPLPIPYQKLGFMTLLLVVETGLHYYYETNLMLTLVYGLITLVILMFEKEFLIQMKTIVVSKIPFLKKGENK